MAIYQQGDFSNGIDLLSDDSKIAQNGCAWLVNARSRFNRIDPIRKHELQDIPEGTRLQGGFSIGNFLVIVIDGKAYYQQDGQVVWIQVPSFQMDSFATEVWMESVPYSTNNFVRKIDENGNIHNPIVLNNDFKVNGTPAAIVVQDGSSQPWLILYDSVNQIFTSRQAKTFDDWQNVSDTGVDREYVPIGRQMKLFNGNKLFIVSADKKSILQSISGRPLDFMVNVDSDGNKLGNEALGGATTMSFNFDSDEITCLENLDIPDGFIYGTSRRTRIITADYNNTIFGEPTYRVTATNLTGIVNQYSVTQGLNDYLQIAPNGITSFNAVQQLKFKGNNSVFSLQLTKLLTNTKTNKPIKQRNCSICYYNNYILACLDTYWGNMVIVYDMLRSTWTSLDITKTVRVKQFILVETSTEDKLYAITSDGKLWKLFSSLTSEVATLRLKAFVPQKTDTEHKSQKFVAFFTGGTYSGKAVLREIVDGQQRHVNFTEDSISSKDLTVTLPGINYPVRPPVSPSNRQNVFSVSWSLPDGLEGKKISFALQWTNDSSLLECQFVDSESGSDASQRQIEETYANSNS